MRPVVIPFFISHLGCPQRCVFCDQEKIAGARGVLPDASQLLEKIAAYRAGSPGRSFEAAFYGGSFTALPRSDQQYLLAVLQPLLASGELSSLRLSTRPDAVDAATASFLKGMGVQTVELGVQSMNEEVLALAGRGHTARHAELAVQALQDAGLEVGVQLMPGLPGDSRERTMASLERILVLRPNFLRIYPTLVVAGTELAARFEAGSYTALSVDQAVDWCKALLRAARQAGVPVIRLGLQPTAELDSPGVVLAGPYHPAFGQLVESELCYDLMCSLVSGIPKGSRVGFLAPAGRTSDLVGQGRRNLARLAERFGVTVDKVREDASLAADAIGVEWNGGQRVGSLQDL